MVAFFHLQVVFKVLCDLHNQMGTIHAVNVVVVTRIHEVIQQLTVVDAVLDKDEAVLPHHHGVGGTVDHQKLAFEFVGFVLKTG